MAEDEDENGGGKRSLVDIEGRIAPSIEFSN